MRYFTGKKDVELKTLSHLSCKLTAAQQNLVASGPSLTSFIIFFIISSKKGTGNDLAFNLYNS